MPSFLCCRRTAAGAHGSRSAAGRREGPPSPQPRSPASCVRGVGRTSGAALRLAQPWPECDEAAHVRDSVTQGSKGPGAQGPVVPGAQAQAFVGCTTQVCGAQGCEPNGSSSQVLLLSCAYMLFWVPIRNVFCFTGRGCWSCRKRPKKERGCSREA